MWRHARPRHRTTTSGSEMSRDPAVFLAVVGADGELQYEFPTQRRAYCTRLVGQCVDVMITPQGEQKTRQQEKGFHAMIQPWAKDEGHRIDDLKRDILAHVFGHIEHTNPLTGEIIQVLREPHTSKLSRAKYSELIERTLELGAECGYVLVAPSEWRREQDKKRKEARAS